MPAEPVSITPMAAWSLQGSSVIALQGCAGTPEDTTVLHPAAAAHTPATHIANLYGVPA